ncbi:purine-cytosine permease [Podospora aff. communis PSN243]|uniref:Purine-cytosine permease n=1 Tax=Podospora aff. communis PSN243 TaxID=3040156 RepID=A0AAV9GVT3_9PEZI|nr:purine-cytosine permease [Podospora aff. communis PSN243]
MSQAKKTGELSLAVTEKSARSGDTTETDWGNKVVAGGVAVHEEIQPNSVEDVPTSAENGFKAKLRQLKGKLGIEEIGIERVPEDKRKQEGMYRIAMLWMSANLTAPTMAIGAAGIPTFRLGFVDAALVIVLVNIVGIMPVCLFSALGARFGLRQMVLSRFYFGYYFGKFAAVLNIITLIGWTVLNVLVAAQIIHALNSNIPAWASIVITSAIALVVALIGHTVLHVFETWAVVPCLVAFLTLLGAFASSQKFEGLLPLAAGQAESNAIFSFATAIYGATSGWCLCAADYLVYQPANRPTSSIYYSTFFSLAFPIIFTQLLGLTIMTPYSDDPAFRSAYDTGGFGAVLAHVLLPLGVWGKFCLVLFALTIVAINSPPIYSVSFSLQLISRHTERISRYLWPIITTVLYVAIAIIAYVHFATWLGNFLVIFGYWVAIYQTIAYCEHYLYLRGERGYRPDDYQDATMLPKGWAALAGTAAGVFGTVLGMVTAFWIGPVAKALGGVDVGMLMAFLLGGVTFIGIRGWERGKWPGDMP